MVNLNTTENITVEEEVKRPNVGEYIQRVIKKIKLNRNRPCYQNILTLINRGGYDLDMDTIKDTLNNMVEKNILSNDEKDGKESFNLCNHENLQETNTNLSVTDPEQIVENILDGLFYETLITRIKAEVKIAMDENTIEKERNNKSLNHLRMEEYTTLIESLKSEISFLRSELLSKDKIIDMVLKDKSLKCDVQTEK